MENIWDIINIPMGYVMRFLNNIAGNQYIIALFLFAIVIEIILVPMGIKQQKNSIKQAKLRPKEMAIRKKYAGRDDQVTRQKVQTEIQELYQKEGYSPFSGCGPMLIQLPVLMALYYIVLNPMKYICRLSTDAINNVITVVKGFNLNPDATYDTTRTINLMDDVRNIINTHGMEPFKNIEGFSDKISSAADLPELSVFGLNLAGTPSFTNFNWLMLIPVLTFAAYFFSMKMTRKFQPNPMQDAQAGCSNKMMDLMMPLMSVWICFMVPAAIGVYWIFKSLIGVLKQFILNKAMPLPKFTDEDYKAAEKEYASKPEKSVRRTNSSGKPVRSLHHIDDEDFPDTAQAAAERRARLEAAEKAEADKSETDKKGSIVEAAPLKEDKNDKTDENN